MNAITTIVSLLAAASFADAATIVSASSFTGISAEADLDNSGILVSAINYTNAVGTGPTINDISFTNQSATTGLVTNFGNLQILNSSTYWSGATGTFDAYDALFDGRANSDTNNGGTTIGIGLSGLGIGQQYTIQMLSGDAALNHTTSFYRSATLGAKTEKLINQQAIGAGQTYLGGTFTATFTTDDGNAFFTLERSGPDNQAVLGGYVLTTVPEPSSTALLGLAGLALILRRRR